MDAGTELPMLDDTKSTGPQHFEKFKQYLATITVSLGAVCVGSCLAWTSPVLPQILASNHTSAGQLQLTESQGATVGAMLAVGALLSALPAGYVADKLGRKRAIILFALPFKLNWVLVMFAKNAAILYGARFFAGVATGAMCVLCPMYIGEIAAASIRGALGSFFQMFVCVGILLTYFVGALVDWRMLSFILGMVPVLFVLFFSTMPETPAYLIRKNDIDFAERTLRMFRGPKYDVESELKQIQRDIEEANSKNATVKDLVASLANRKALVSSLGLMAFQQLSGINAVIFYTVPIFQSAGSSLSPDFAAIIVAVIQLIIAYAAFVLMEKADRRFYLMLSSAGMGMCSAALGFYFHLQKHEITAPGLGILPLASLALFIVAFSLGYGPVPWMIMSELFAPEIKGIASGLAVMTNWVLVFVVTFSFPLMNTSFGGHVTFYIFALIMAGATAFVYFIVPETRGRSLQEVQKALSE